MKALKSKITEELKRLEHRASLSETSLRTDTLNEVYKLAKTLCYLEKAESIMAGTHDGKTVGTM